LAGYAEPQTRLGAVDKLESRRSIGAAQRRPDPIFGQPCRQ
jgi:hypothetical protein